MSQTGGQSAATDEQTNLSQQQQEKEEIRISVALNHSRPCPDLIDGDSVGYLRFAVPLYRASVVGDWSLAQRVLDHWSPAQQDLDRRPDLLRYSITYNGETALHVAASAERTKRVEKFVEQLVKYMEVKDLELVDNNSNTALCIVTAAGNLKLAKIMVERNRALLTIPGSEGMMPLHIAAMFGHREVVEYLYENSRKLCDDDGWTPEKRHSLLLKCVEADLFDVALTIVMDRRELRSSGRVLDVLARKPDAFCYRRSNVIMRIFNWVVGVNEKEESSSDALRLLRIIWTNLAKRHRNETDVILRGPPDPPFKQGDKQDQILELLKQISDGINKMTVEIQNIIKEPSAAMQRDPNEPLLLEDANKRYSSQILFVAAEMGNTTFVTTFLRVFPHLILKVNDKNQSIFHTAVEHRHMALYNILYEIGSKKDQITLLTDTNGNNMLHLVGKIPKRTRLEENSGGVALQMQLELLW